MIGFEHTKWSFIYWYFNHNGIEVWNDRKNPIIPSIASVRYWQPRLPIYVIDVSKKKNFWGDYPRQFNFEVISQKSVYTDVSRQESKFLGPVSHELLGKTNDVWFFSSKLNSEYYAVLDSDLFWVQNPLPLHGSGTNKFWMSKEANTGFYYYHKNSPDFIALWRGLNNLAVWEEDFRKRVAAHVKYDIVQEEAVCGYALDKFGNCGLDRYPISENFTTAGYAIQKHHKDAANAKVLHILNKHCKDDSLTVAQSVIEIRAIMQKMFSEDQYKEIFKDAPLASVSYKNPLEMKKILTLSA